MKQLFGRCRVYVWWIYFVALGVVWLATSFVAVYVVEYADTRSDGLMLIDRAHAWWLTISGYVVVNVAIYAATRYHFAVRRAYGWVTVLSIIVMVVGAFLYKFGMLHGEYAYREYADYPHTAPENGHVNMVHKVANETRQTPIIIPVINLAKLREL